MKKMEVLKGKWPLLLAAVALPSVALAAEPEGRYSSVDTIWVLLGAILVYFMQPGFAMVETGLTCAKNAGNIVMKNFMDFALGTVVFWFLGFGLMFGTDIGGIIGTPDRSSRCSLPHYPRRSRYRRCIRTSAGPFQIRR